MPPAPKVHAIVKANCRLCGDFIHSRQFTEVHISQKTYREVTVECIALMEVHYRDKHNIADLLNITY